MSRYAANTTVSADRSRAEIERTLQRYGAEQFLYGWDQEFAVIGFRMEGRYIRFKLAMPDKNDEQFILTPAKRRPRAPEDQLKEWEKACRQRWRALLLLVKAKLEAVESGITTFPAEFLAHTLLPDGKTVGELVEPQVQLAYETGQMAPLLLPWSGNGAEQ